MMGLRDRIARSIARALSIEVQPMVNNAAGTIMKDIIKHFSNDNSITQAMMDSIINEPIDDPDVRRIFVLMLGEAFK